MSKIAFISTMSGAPWGGSEELWSQTALHLLKQGHMVSTSVQGWTPLPIPVQKLLDAGCRVEHRRSGGIARRVVRRVASRVGLLAKNWLDQVKPELVVISQGDAYSGIEWAGQCQRRQIPYALVVHTSAESAWPEDDYAEKAAKCYDAATASYFVSQGNLQLVRKQLTIPLTAAKVVRNPFNVSYDANVPWPEEENGLRLACVGRLDPKSKGQDILFDVLREKKWKQRQIEVTLYGQGPNCATLKKLSGQYSLNSVVFAGFTSHVEDIWKTHHALVLPSRFEGLPLAVVEAMLCGRPCIVTDVAGNAELLEDGVTGFVAAAPTAHHLDEAIERAWMKRSELRQMGQLAGERVRQQVPRDPIAAFSEELCKLL